MASQWGAIHWRLATQLEDLTWAHYDVPPELASRYSQLRSQAQSLIERIDQLARAAASASAQYSWREGVMTSVSEQAMGHVMYLAGRLLPVLPAAVVPFAPEIAIGAVVLVGGVLLYRGLSHAHASSTGRRAPQLEVLLKQQFGEIGSRFVALAVSGADNFVAGALSLPEESLNGMGPQGISAVATGAATVLSAPFLAETPVRVTRTSATTTPQPHTLAAMVARIPHGEANGAQIRIEKYDTEKYGTEKYDESHPPSRHSYIVYVGGTAEASWTPNSEPWDMTSNVTALGNGESGSERAVVAAMREAGIRAGDSVTMVGHSQGGLVVARVAQSGDFHVTHVVTVGAPIHNIDLPEQTQLIALEHTEDVIPSLSGVDHFGPTFTPLNAAGLSSPAVSTVAVNAAGLSTVTVSGAILNSSKMNLATSNTTQTSNELVIRNSTFNEKAPQVGHSLAAHSLERYVATAKQVDHSSDPRALEVRTRLFGETSPSGGRAETARETPAQVTMWHANRIPPS